MAAPFLQPLPPGVYFNPSAEECVRDYLRPWRNAGVRPATDRIIVDVNVYSDRPDTLLRGRQPGFSRGFHYKSTSGSCSPTASACAGARRAAPRPAPGATSRRAATGRWSRGPRASPSTPAARTTRPAAATGGAPTASTSAAARGSASRRRGSWRSSPPRRTRPTPPPEAGEARRLAARVR
ncbi:hypothetical protein PVAP13_3KG052627 [Panicum virgatum]|uniref:NAC domain-containing protein n=1 Tax=Panicum virgatum TaxID=38727 RepID=A0A8T0UF70_PANVG|nr:hypothetical protein PVAP13_3KG052627 [Panicum virgatum]